MLTDLLLSAFNLAIGLVVVDWLFCRVRSTWHWALHDGPNPLGRLHRPARQLTQLLITIVNR